jgi:hypothetical protein
MFIATFKSLGLSTLSVSLAVGLTGLFAPAAQAEPLPEATIPGMFIAQNNAQTIAQNSSSTATGNCRRTQRVANVFTNQNDTNPTSTPLQPNVTVTLTGSRYRPEVVERVEINSPVMGWVEARGLAMCAAGNPNNCRRTSRVLAVFSSSTATSATPNLLLQPSAIVILTGSRYSPPSTDRVQINSPIMGWVDAANLGLCNSAIPPTSNPPTTNRPSLRVRACAVVDPELDFYGGLAVRNGAPEASPIIDLLPSNTLLVLSHESQTLASGRIVTRIIRPNRLGDPQNTPYSGTSWWIYESGPTGVASGYNITTAPCSQLFPGIREGQNLSL